MKYDNWYTVGFNDGRYHINVREHNLFSYGKTKKAGYKEGLKAGRIQHKRDKLTQLVTGRPIND